MPYGSMQVISIAIQAGYGGPWPGFVGYADSITINGRVYSVDD